MATAIAQQPATAARPRVKWVPLVIAIAIGLALYFMPAQCKWKKMQTYYIY